MPEPLPDSPLPPQPTGEGPAATKIVATLGPASEDRLAELIAAGLSVARINFSHGEESDHRRRVDKLRRAADHEGVPIGILADIQGPKLRLGRLSAGDRRLEPGEVLQLVEEEQARRADELPFNFPGFAASVRPGDRVFLADAAVELVVESTGALAATARVRRGGVVGDRKGVHLPDSDLRLELPTEQDRAHIQLARELSLDMLGISFVSCAADVERIRALAGDLVLVAKIERRAAVENLREILRVADGLMVARGDLGVEVRLEQLPLVQKAILQEALAAGRFTITATEMLESMVHASRPTRAEVTDVANAVLDGSDALMLSAETAIGRHPVEAVAAMARIARAVEVSPRYRDLAGSCAPTGETGFSGAVAMGAARMADTLSIRKVVCFTESGNTVRLLSRYRTGAEILALTPSIRTLHAMTVLAHVRPVLFPRAPSLEDMLHAAQNELCARGLLASGEQIVFVAGVPPGVTRSTNVIKLHRVGDPARLH